MFSPLRCAPLCRLLCVLVLLGGFARPSLADPPRNIIQSIRTALTPGATPRPIVEITVTSPRSFGARDEVIHMSLRGQEILHSRSPKGGSLNTLIFQLTPAQWAAARTGDLVAVSYGHDADSGAAGDRWDFGPLDKKMLQGKL